MVIAAKDAVGVITSHVLCELDGRVTRVPVTVGAEYCVTLPSETEISSFRNAISVASEATAVNPFRLS